jgi:protein-S-isoprenylcysteine O-methyltransferase Ste14
VGVQSPPVLAGITALHTVGVALMIGADAQKTAVLRARPGLITDGFFARIRHPNYLGEMMIYGSYALIVWHWLPAVILGCIWGGVFLPNILAKEARLARHPGWEAYEARTGLLWPKL